LALVAEDTKSLSLLKQTRGEPRALTIAALSGVALGVAVGGAFLAGRAAADATHQTANAALSAAVRRGLADAAMQHGATPAATGAPVAVASADTSAPYSVRSTLLHAAVLQASTPFQLAGPVQASRDLDCLTAAVYYEARGETAAGQAAVAQVVLNRVRHPAFPKSVCAVVYQGAATHSCQFSFACNGAMRHGHEPAAWDRSRAVAARALSGSVMDGVGRATHFHVASLGGIWGGGMVRVAQVGGHIFYTFGGRRAQLNAGVSRVSDDASDIASAAPRSIPADGGEARLAVADTATPASQAAKPATASAASSEPAASPGAPAAATPS
jgi:spore germination cell wall hydrolase CwlJ-like protein